MESVNIESMGPVAPVLPSLGTAVVKEATSAPPTLVDTYTVIPSSSGGGDDECAVGAWLLILSGGDSQGGASGRSP